MTNEKLLDALEKVLRAKKAQNPNMAIKDLKTPLIPGTTFVPVELTIDPFGIGQQFRTSFHLFIACKTPFPGVDLA